MLVLGIETSCDETAAAVLEGEKSLLSNIIASQNEIHSKYGGIVPELAGRSHIERIDGIIKQALDAGGVSVNDIDVIAATQGPGLIGSLLVGFNTAKAIAYATGKPFIGVNHLEGHLLAIFLEETVAFPYLALTVSGGHTDICRVNGFCDYRMLGRTRDDAVGESFDKVAKMLDCGYPGGPIIEKMARNGNAEAHKFPRAMLEKDSLDFSFSGLKTSVRNLLEKRKSGEGPKLSDEDIAASFQTAVTDVLIAKITSACDRENLRRVVVTGGVASNGYLREKIRAAGAKHKFSVHIPSPVYCTDNAAMIACAGYYRFKTHPHARQFMALDAQANLAL